MSGSHKNHLGILVLGTGLALSACASDTPPLTPHASLPQQQTFDTPEQAVDTLVAAARSDNKSEMLKILGPQSGKLIHSGDDVADKTSRARFLAAYDKAHELQSENDDRETLIIGSEEWPLPIPLVRVGEGWQWDTPSGQEEVLNRRIGRNELNVIEIMRAYVDAQHEFDADHTDEHKHEYAQHFISHEKGRHDGLYWPPKAGEQESPLGPLLANASAEGYSAKAVTGRAPYHGYYYKILTRQGANAAGGARNYINKKGHMIHGFAMIAFPARYGDSGVMSFIVNQNGIVYEKNLGSDTGKIAPAITGYDPDSDWKVVD